MALARDSLNDRAGEGFVSDTFLEEQLRRIRQLTERMSRITTREGTDGTSRERFGHGPLHDVRDVRIVNSVPQKSSSSDTPVRRSRRRRR